MLSRSCCHLSLPLVHFPSTRSSGVGNGETGGKKATMCLQLQPCPRWEHGSGHKHLPPSNTLRLKPEVYFRNLYLQSQDLLKLIPHYSTPLTILAPVLRTLSADRQQKAWLQRASASTKLAWSPRQLVLPGMLAGELVPCASWFPQLIAAAGREKFSLRMKVSFSVLRARVCLYFCKFTLGKSEFK